MALYSTWLQLHQQGSQSDRLYYRSLGMCLNRRSEHQHRHAGVNTTNLRCVQCQGLVLSITTEKSEQAF